MRYCRRHRTRIIAHHHQDPAMGRGADGMGMLHGIAGPVRARPLAVPDAEHTIDGGIGIGIDLLRAYDGRRRQLFVDGRLEFDAVFVQVGLRLPESAIVAAQRRTAITGNKSAGIKPSRFVALSLNDG